MSGSSASRLFQLTSFFLAVAALGCGDDLAQVEVRVRTDLVPRYEFDSIRVLSSTDEVIAEVSALDTSTDWFAGQSVTDIEVAPGVLELTVEASLSGTPVVTRPIAIRAKGELTTTVVLTRSCLGSSCPTSADSELATSCLGAECVTPGCQDGSQGECTLFNSLPQCEREIDCPQPSPCAEPRCAQGVCVYEAFPDRCGESQYCDAFRGCTNVDPTMRDAGVPDAGPPDAGRPGFTNSLTMGTTSETGTTVNIALRPTGAPMEDVIVTANAPSDEIAVNPESRTLGGGAMAPLVFTVTGQDDEEADGTQMATIVFTVRSADTLWDGIVVDRTIIENLDDDSPGLLFTSAGAQEATEGGTDAMASIRLATAPSAEVTVNVASADAAQATATPAALTFTTGNWDTPQMVAISAVDDAAVDGDMSVEITATATSADAAYEGVRSMLAYNIIDDDMGGITVTATDPMMSEAGDTATVDVVLTAPPTADVMVAIALDPADEGMADMANLTFTMANWDTPQTVTITGQDDAEIDGAVSVTLSATTTSADTAFDGLSGMATLMNADDDAATIELSATDATMTEGGETATVDVVLSAPPTSDVTVMLTLMPAAEGMLDMSMLTFTAANWDTPQTVTITGQEDMAVDGNVMVSFMASATSMDANYMGQMSAVTLTNADNDAAGLTVTPTDTSMTEGMLADTATVDVVLSAQPTADVTLGLSLDDATEGVLMGGVNSLTFTSANWDTPQTITVEPVADGLNDGDVMFNLTITVTGGQAEFMALGPETVVLTNVNVD